MTEEVAPKVPQAKWPILVLWGVVLCTPIVWQTWIAPPTATEIAERQQRDAAVETARKRRAESEEHLCRQAAACKKYSEARLECATAGNFRTCLRIKMGADAIYSNICSGFDEGGPAVPLPAETPNAVKCFFINLGFH
jgi:hypothetical protein